MAPKYKSAVLLYFIISEDGKSFICKCKAKGDIEEECGKKISSFTGGKPCSPLRVSNLKRHLNRKHSDVFIKVSDKDRETLEKRKHLQNLQQHYHSKFKQVKLTSFLISKKIEIAITKDAFISFIIEMVVKNSVPLRFFTLPTFKKLNGELAKKLNISLDRNNIRLPIIFKKHIIKKTYLKV